MTLSLAPLRSHSRRSASAALVLVLAAGAARAQNAADAPETPPLRVGEAVSERLSAKETDRYTLSLEAGQFVRARADQISVDVAVTVYDASGKRLGGFDGPARGPEWFQFESGAAGEYRIEVAPFEGGEGDYTLEVVRVEPVATEPAARVDQLMAAYDGPEIPGGVVGVVREGELVFAGAYGSANLTHDIPFEVDTRTNIGSTSKQFTAYGIALLAEQGKLSLDDDVREHIPELPDLGATVTLRHLLTHTSGYREFLNTIILTGRRLDRGDSIDRAELIEIVQRQPELQNEPAAEWNYNNTGYGLLAEVIARVGGSPFPRWMEENVFRPLGMLDTFVRENPAAIIENSAQGYAPNDDGEYINATDLGGAMGAGGIYTTVGDLARWVANFKAGTLGGPEIFAQMSTPYELNDGKSANYGLGLFIDEYRGLERIHHGGADTAHRSMLMYFPQLDAAVITLSNNATFTGSIANSVADAFFGGSMGAQESAETAAPAEPGEFDPTQFEPESFDAYAGRYELEEMPGFVLSFSREGDRYYTQATGQPRAEIFPISADEFELRIVEASVTFERNEDGVVDSIVLHQNGDHRARRMTDEAWAPTADDLAAYAGRYYSEELETFYDVVVQEGKLVIQHRRLDDVALAPGKEHRFTGGMPIAEVEFHADEQGAITGLEVGNGRTRGVRFDRVR